MPTPSLWYSSLFWHWQNNQRIQFLSQGKTNVISSALWRETPLQEHQNFVSWVRASTMWFAPFLIHTPASWQWTLKVTGITLGLGRKICIWWSRTSVNFFKCFPVSRPLCYGTLLCFQVFYLFPCSILPSIVIWTAVCEVDSFVSCVLTIFLKHPLDVPVINTCVPILITIDVLFTFLLVFSLLWERPFFRSTKTIRQDN